MQKKEYEKFILPMKKEYEEPLGLHLEALGSRHPRGYWASDINFLHQQWAKKNGACFFNIINFLESVYLGDDKEIKACRKTLKRANKIVTSDLFLYTNLKQNKASVYWSDFFVKLQDIWKDGTQKEKRIVMPLSLMFGKVQHCAVACFNFKPQQDEVDIVFLEQHAQDKEKVDYDAEVDYAEGVRLHLKIWADIMHRILRISKVNTFTNTKPICRRRNVCGVVASELARRLLKSSNPMKWAKAGIRISYEKVDCLHAPNQKLEKSH